MMIRLIKSTDIDREKWDFCIKNSQAPMIYAVSWYLDIMTENWMALVENDYQSVFPICYKKRFFFTKINQPTFIQQLGLFSLKPISTQVFESFLNHIPKTFFGTTILCNYSNNQFLTHSKTLLRDNYVLNLNHTYSELYKSYTENQKRNIKKAIQNELIINENKNKTFETLQFYAQNVPLIFNAISKNDWANFQKVCIKATENQKCFSISINNKNEIVSMAIFFEFENRITYILGSTNEAGKKLGANHFLIDYMVQKYAQTDFVLDFEGSNVASLARFYTGFGAKNQPYMQIEI